MSLVEYTRLLQRGQQAADATDWEGAAAAFGQAIALMPDHPNGYLLLGAVRGQQGDWRRAVQAYRELLRLTPSSAKLRHALGEALERMGDLRGAAAQFHEFAHLAPDAPAAWFILARARFRLGQFDLAEKALRATLERADFVPARDMLAQALIRQGRVAEAIATWQAALAVAPGEPVLTLNLAAALLEAGRAEEALEHYSGLRLGGEAQAAVFFGQGVALADLGRDAEAIAAFQEALRRRPDWAEARHNLAWVSGRAGEVAAAKQHYDLLAGKQPRDLLAHLGQGVAAAASEDAPGAGAAARRAQRVLREAIAPGASH